MNREEFIGKLQMVYVGDKNASADIISEFDRLNNDIKILLKENGNKEKVIIKQDNIIKEVREYIKENTLNYYTDIEETNEEFELICDPQELLEILDKEREVK